MNDITCFVLEWCVLSLSPMEGYSSQNCHCIWLQQGKVDGSASKPALRQDTGYMVEKTYHDIAPYLGAFGAYLMPQ